MDHVRSSKGPAQPLLVDLAAGVFSIKQEETASQTLGRWAIELLALRARVEAGDVASAVVIGWQLDMVESGTLTEVNAAVRTRARYARVATLRLWRMLAALPADIDLWSPQAMHAGYEAMMLDPTCRDLAGLGAAISGFQAFAQEAFGLAPLPFGLHKLIPEPVPRAQWIPSTAIRRAIRWIDEDAAGDPRLKKICALMILLAGCAPLRLSELRWIRLSNVGHAADGSIEIEITALSGSSRLKSAAAQRRIRVTDPEIVTRLVSLIHERDAEGAPPNALLFAAADDDFSPYRPHAVHVTVLRLLKQATGDPTMTFHALRHTFISNAMEEIMSSSSVYNGSRLSQLADWAGHVVPVTTLKFYSHWFEFALRTQIDANLLEQPLSNTDGEHLLGAKANSLTVAARRRGLLLGEYLWAAIERRAEALAQHLPHAAVGLDLHDPTAPSLVGPLSRNFTIFHCFTALHYLTLNMAPGLIQHRMHLTVDQVTSIDKAATEVARSVYAKHGWLLPTSLTCARAVVEHFDLDLARAEQARYAGFRESLALPIDTALAADAAQTWIAAWRDGELSADPPERLVPLLAFLKSAGVATESLLLNYENDPANPEGVQRLLASAANVAAAIFHDHLPAKAIPTVRRGRERAYLVWPSRADVGQAGRSNAGFDALMFAVAVWSRPEVQEWR